MPFRPSPILLNVAHMPQRQSGDCLAACAAMSLGYHKIRFDYEPLVRLLRIQRPYGTAFSSIRELGKLGVTVQIASGTIQHLHQQLLAGRPCIVPVQTGQLPYWQFNTAHVVVVVGMDNDTILLNDPDVTVAPVQISLGDFDLAWFEQEEVYAVIVP